MGCMKRSRTRVGGHFTVPQLQFERLHRAAALAQEAAQLFEQRLERAAKPLGVADLRLEIAPRREFFACRKPRARFGQAAHGTIEHGEQVCAETAREAITWQAQAFADRAHAHRAQQLLAAIRPAGAARGSGESRLGNSSRRRINTGIVDPAWRANHNDASGAGVMARRTVTPVVSARSACSNSHRRRAPPNRRRLPRTSSSTPSGGSRLTRGVKLRPRLATASSVRRSRRVSRASVCSDGSNANAELMDMPGRTPCSFRCSHRRRARPCRCVRDRRWPPVAGQAKRRVLRASSRASRPADARRARVHSALRVGRPVRRSERGAAGARPAVGLFGPRPGGRRW